MKVLQLEFVHLVESKITFKNPLFPNKGLQLLTKKGSANISYSYSNKSIAFCKIHSLIE